MGSPGRVREAGVSRRAPIQARRAGGNVLPASAAPAGLQQNPYAIPPASQTRPGLEIRRPSRPEKPWPQTRLLHAARQPPKGRGTRKLGELEAIVHARRGLEGEACGSVAIIPSRPIAGGQLDAGFREVWCVW